MSNQRTDSNNPFASLTLRGKREYLSVLCDVVWDIETELAKANAERAALMSSLQTDLHDNFR
jgi:hypothetical protein